MDLRSDQKLLLLNQIQLVLLQKSLMEVVDILLLHLSRSREVRVLHSLQRQRLSVLLVLLIL